MDAKRDIINLKRDKDALEDAIMQLIEEFERSYDRVVFVAGVSINRYTLGAGETVICDVETEIVVR